MRLVTNDASFFFSFFLRWNRAHFTNKNQHWNKRDVISIRVANRRRRQPRGWILKTEGEQARQVYDGIIIIFMKIARAQSQSFHSSRFIGPRSPQLLWLLIGWPTGYELLNNHTPSERGGQRGRRQGVALLPAGWRGLTSTHTWKKKWNHQEWRMK